MSRCQNVSVPEYLVVIMSGFQKGGCQSVLVSKCPVPKCRRIVLRCVLNVGVYVQNIGFGVCNVGLCVWSIGLYRASHPSCHPPKKHLYLKKYFFPLP